MKRAALLFLTIGAPLALLFFPGLRRAIRRKTRALLLLYVAFILTVGLFARATAESSPFSARDAALTLLGTTIVVVAFASVLRDALRDKSR